MVTTQEETIDEMQSKHDWKRREWEREKQRQYLEEEQSSRGVRQLPYHQEAWQEQIEEDFTDVFSREIHRHNLRRAGCCHSNSLVTLFSIP